MFFVRAKNKYHPRPNPNFLTVTFFVSGNDLESVFRFCNNSSSSTALEYRNLKKFSARRDLTARRFKFVDTKTTYDFPWLNYIGLRICLVCGRFTLESYRKNLYYVFFFKILIVGYKITIASKNSSKNYNFFEKFIKKFICSS